MSLDNFTLITGQNINQGIQLEAGKTKKGYVRASALCMFDADDFKNLDVIPGTPVKVTTDFGEVIVYSTISEEGPHPGVIFMPAGPWANQVISSDAYLMGTPIYKGIDAKVEVAKGGKVLDTLELIATLGKELEW